MPTLELLGGLGLGAGLMYLLDPQQGEARRDRVLMNAVDYGQQAGGYWDDTRRSLGRQAQAVLATTRRPFRRQPSLGERLLAHTAQVGPTTAMALVGCLGLGVGLGYLWARQGSARKQARLREKTRNYWRRAETRNTYQQALSRRWRFFQGHDTSRVDAHTQKPAQAEAWYAEPRAYDSPVLYSEPFVTRDEAEAWAEAQDRP